MRLFAQITLIFILLVCSGCAHQRLMNAGDDYLNQGQYQRAVDKYQAALDREPHNQETQQKLSYARQQFNDWLNQVKLAAQTAEQQGQIAKAQLLYAKLAKHRNMPDLSDKAYELNKKNLEQYGLSLHLDIKQTQLRQSLQQRFSQIRFLSKPPKASALKQNVKNMQITLGGMTIDTIKQQNEASQQYISGYETIVNPEYDEIQHQISNLREIKKEAQGRLYDRKQQTNVLGKDLSLLEKDLEIALLKLEKLAQNSNQYNALVSDISKLRSKITQQRKKYNASKKQVIKAENNLFSYDSDLDELFHMQEETPQLAKVDIYTDYIYPVFLTEQQAKATLTVKTSGAVRTQRRYAITAVYTDESNDAHEIIGLDSNPLNLKSQSEMQQLLDNQARLKVVELIEKEVAEYKNYLTGQASNATAPSVRLNSLLLAGIVSKLALSPGEMQKVKQALQAEFGNAGIFEVEELLMLKHNNR